MTCECAICGTGGYGLIYTHLEGELFTEPPHDPDTGRWLHSTCLRKSLIRSSTALGRIFRRTRVARNKRHDGPCIMWQGSVTRDGYALMSHRGRTVRVHRWLQGLEHLVPSFIEVMHSCDRPGCVSVAHLSLGTKAANMADMMRKGRGRNQYGVTNRR